MLSPALTDPRALARELAVRHAFVLFALVFCVAAVVNGWVHLGGPWVQRLPAVGYAAAAVACVLATRMPDHLASRALFAVSVLGVMLVCATAVIYGWGLNGPGVGFFAIVTLVFAAFFSLRSGIAMALLCIALLGALGWAEQQHWIVGPAALGDTLVLRRWITLSLLVAAGLGTGVLTVRVIGHWLGTAREREARFLTLLGIATDCYWEMDDTFVVTALWRRGGPEQAFLPVPQPMQRPWEQEGLLYDSDQALAAHRADLQAHRPFRDLHVRWRWPDGSCRHELASGSPRLDSQGRFIGYWGVSRDVTAEYTTRDHLKSAEDAQRDSQALLQQLITMNPDLVVLTEADSGRFVMVNAAFERVMGYAASEVIGRTSIEVGTWRRPEDRQRLLDALQADGSVQDMAIEFRTRDGRTLPMSLSAARFEMQGRQYLALSSRDMSQAELARREREAILANASIGIAMTRDRRFVMVNRRFEELYGWPPGELIDQPGDVVWPGASDYAEIGRLAGPALSRGEVVELVRPARRRDGSTFIARAIGKAVDPQRPREGGTIWIVDDITERQQVERALALARDAAEAASRAKSAFLANTSHEIRTPLNGLLGLARLARQRGVDDALRQSYLDQIADSAEILSTIISDILDLSKIEAGKLEIESAEFDLRALLRELARAYTSLTHARGLQFELQLDELVPARVRGDAMRLRQVLTNFLTNALKFTERGRVTLRAKPAGPGRLRLEVEDTGPGIDAATQRRLFQPFSQADDSITRRFGGTGLGLSICRELARLMGGEVGLRSEVGHGSCFHVELPLPAALPAATAAADTALPVSPLEGARVLLVEDNPVNMMVASAMLEQWGLRVVQARNGREALDAVARAATAGPLFDAVLMDVQMPDMSGYEATRELRRHHSADQLPVIALTAAALVSEREQALAQGMNDFLTKPIDGDRLRSALARWIRRGSEPVDDR